MSRFVAIPLFDVVFHCGFTRSLLSTPLRRIATSKHFNISRKIKKHQLSWQRSILSFEIKGTTSRTDHTTPTTRYSGVFLLQLCNKTILKLSAFVSLE